MSPAPPAPWTRDQILAAAGIALTAVALLVGIGIAIWQRNKKRLGCEKWPASKLVTLKPNMKGRLKVTFDDKLIEEPHFSAVRICNAGGIEIRKDDFEVPLSVTAETTIISAYVYNVKPAELAPKLSFDDKVVTFEPLLLNAGDTFLLGVVTDGPPGSIAWRGRIVGGELRTLTSEPRRIFWSALQLLLVPPLTAFVSVLLYVSIKSTPPTQTGMGVVFLIGVVLSGVILAFTNPRLGPERWR